jgi:fructokinase
MSHDSRTTLEHKTPESNKSVGPLLEIETFSEEGLRYRSRLPSGESNGWEWLKAYAVEQVKDMAGAGDWCTAGVIHRLGQQGLQGLQQVTSAQLLNALYFGQALAAWNCRFEGARGGMYSVNKVTFRCDIEQILSGNGLNRRLFEPSSSAVQGVFGDICPTCGDKRIRVGEA